MHVDRGSHPRLARPGPATRSNGRKSGMTEINQELQLVGDALQRAWRRDHAQTRGVRRRRFVFALILCTLVLGAGAAIANSVLKTEAEEQAGLLGGHHLFDGSHPTCVKLTGTSFHCTLQERPTGMTFSNQQGEPVQDVYLGFKTPTVDVTKHVDGGCVAVQADGRAWDCYLGQEA